MLFQSMKQCCGKNSNDKAPMKVLFCKLIKTEPSNGSL